MNTSLSSIKFLADRYQITANLAEFDFQFICAELKKSYWAQQRSEKQIRQSFENSFAKMLYIDKIPVAFARLITDYVSFAYLGDVVVHENYRHQGIASLLVKNLLTDKRVAEVKRFWLRTKDAHDLYRKLGFSEPSEIEKLMEKINL